MKLNLVPTYVSKERQGRTFIVLAVLIFAMGAAGSVLMTLSSQQRLRDARAANEEAKPKAALAVDTSNKADAIIASAAQIIKDTNLAQEMIKHNDVYPDFYTQDVIPYIPPFYRINSLTAQAVDGATCTVTMVGTLKTYQQYADLVLSLMRIKGAVSISRQGFSGDQFMVPGISQDDPHARRRKVNEPPLPDDPIQRLTYLESTGSGDPGFVGTGGYGSGDDSSRFAAPEESLVTIVMTIAKNLQTPNPRATLATSAASTAGLTSGAPGGAPFGAPGGMGPGGPPPGVGPMGAPGGGAPAGKAGKDD